MRMGVVGGTLWVVTFIVGMLGGRADGGGKVIFAVNAGGEAHVDINGIHYQKDPLKVGIASDYGKVTNGFQKKY